MATAIPGPRIFVAAMPQLSEAVDQEDDWTGITDAATRRKRQNRLNVRAYRKRKAQESISQIPYSKPPSTMHPIIIKTEPMIPCWVEDQQSVTALPASLALSLFPIEAPLIPCNNDREYSSRIIFPLSSDHLITLLQFNVLRACLVNYYILRGRDLGVVIECSSTSLHAIDTTTLPYAIPPSLQTTHIQRSIPHESWVDLIPHPGWRDNLILASGNFDEAELYLDTLGGLFEGYSAANGEQNGLIVWSPPWHFSGWEMSPGFWKKWGWSLWNCEDVMESTNRWRQERGEEPLLFENLYDPKKFRVEGEGFPNLQGAFCVRTK